jgi:hypothetical protein
MDQADRRMDKTAFSVVSLAEADDDVAYWRTRTPQERLEALEVIRQTLYGYAGTAPRLRRLLIVARRERG